MLSNFHTHTRFCDGIGEPEDYIKEAINKGFSMLGFSAHSPVPFETSWAMKEQNANEYFETIDNLKWKYKNDIQIYKGIEIDYFTDDKRDIFTKYDLDYIIGSVHYVGTMEKGEPYIVDGNKDEFEYALNEGFNGDIKEFAKAYYELIIEMMKRYKFDILGHVDIIKKNNKGDTYFKESSSWYKNIVKKVIEEVEKHDIIVEVNTGGISRGYVDEPYPSQWILSECRKLDIPVMLNSDAHSPINIDCDFKRSLKMIKETGYKEIFVMDKGEWKRVKI